MIARCCVVSLALAGSSAAQDWTSTGGPGGGEIVSLGSVGGALIAGGATGAARSVDDGATWALIPDLDGLAITSMASIDQRVIAATFEGDILASDDEGLTWQDLGGPAPGESGVDMHASAGLVYLISVDLNDQLNGRLWVSDDAGEAWSEIDLPTNEAGTFGAISVHADGSLLVVGSTDPAFNGFKDVVLRSDNGGEDWAIIEDGIPFLSLGVQPIVAIGDALFAGTGNAGVLRSMDAGQTWINDLQITDDGPPNQVRDMVTSDGSVYAVGTKLDGGQNDVGPGLWRSDDLGEIWMRTDTGLPVGFLNSTNDLHASDGTLLLGGRFISLWVSEDDGASWAKSVEGLGLSDVLALAAGPDTLHATPAATQEVWRFDGDTWAFGQTPSPPGVAFGQVLELHADGASIVFAGTQGHGIFRSSDGGESFDAVNNGVPTYNGTAGLQRREIEAFVGSGETIYAGTGVGIEFFGGNFGFSGGGALRSVNGGSSWQSINAGLPIIAFNDFGDPIFDPIIAMHEHDGALLAGHFLGSGIFRSVNGGTTWTPANAGLTGTPEIRDLETFNGHVFAAGAFGGAPVWRSEDGGQSWSPASLGLPGGQRGSSLAVADGVLYVGIVNGGSVAGVYQTTDGVTWDRAGKSLDGVPVRRLAARADGAVAAGTFGRGVWQLGGCLADFNGDGALDILDFVAFQDAFTSGDESADCDANGELNVLDFVCFQGVFQAGCN